MSNADANATSSVTVLPFSELDDEGVQARLSEHQIGLTVEEARKVTELLGRDPTLTEAVIWGIQGSEHCSYKSSRRFLKGFTTSGKHIILGPVEDSGIVAITDNPKGKRWGLAITHESHNHPSQIVPYEGAATGVGGTVRDVVCMGARVIGCMDMLRLGDLQTEEIRTIANEVIRGIGGYGNPLGVANLGGDTVFDASYNSNCLVNAIALGIVREDEIIHSFVPKEAGEVGYDIILVGKPTDRSGFGGASFASASMEEEKREQNSGAVQEPNPFLERHILAASYALFDWLVANNKLDKVSCKDLGAGGVVCASVEQVADVGFGAEVDLDKVHVALDGLPPEVIGCAETQERLCFTCHPDLTDHIVNHFNKAWDLPGIAENARASVIGKVTTEPVFRLRHNGSVVCEASAMDITQGLQYKRPVEEVAFGESEPECTCSEDTVTVSGTTLRISEVFSAMLTHPNGCNKAPVFTHFDKNIIGNTVLEPGESDAAVLAPLQDLESYVHEGTHPDWESLPEGDKWAGVALAADGNGRYGRISPYLQGVNATVESMRNVVATGATPRAITDCLNYGNPEIPSQLWELQEGVRGIAEASATITFEDEPVPVISGNVSLYNGKPDGSSIDPTAVVCCAGMMADARKAVSIQIKESNSPLFLVGQRKDECGGSLYYQILEELSKSGIDTLLGANVPNPSFKEAEKEMQFILGAHKESLLEACHDISDGGLLLALFEMLVPQRKIGGNIGASIDLATLKSALRTDVLLFSQTGGFLVSVSDTDAFKSLAEKSSVPVYQIGVSTPEPTLHVQNGATELLHEKLETLIERWDSSLRKHLS